MERRCRVAEVDAAPEGTQGMTFRAQSSRFMSAECWVPSLNLLNDYADCLSFSIMADLVTVLVNR
jgi:hypothetical protein